MRNIELANEDIGKTLTVTARDSKKVSEPTSHYRAFFSRKNQAGQRTVADIHFHKKVKTSPKAKFPPAEHLADVNGMTEDTLILILLDRISSLANFENPEDYSPINIENLPLAQQHLLEALALLTK